MKKSSVVIFAVAAVVIVGFLFFSFGVTSPPETAQRAVVGDSSESGDSNLENLEDNIETLAMDNKVAINMPESMFMFEGFGPGKSHEGIFTDWEGNLFLDSEEISGFEGTIQASSADTGISGLDNHLQAESFFNTAAFPEINFVSKSLSEDRTELVGDLTLRGVTKEITIPVEIEGQQISADFVVNTEPFGMSNTGVNDEVRIAFSFSS